MKENVIIGRLIPAGKHYTGENGVNPDAEYFDPEEAAAIILDYKYVKQ